MRLSICIPTYNRSRHLTNCLASIETSRRNSDFEIQVCVSDNCSTDDTEQVVRAAQERMSIDYHRNERNLGIPRNFLRVVEMAKGDFVWLLGDDDLLLPNAIQTMCALIGQYRDVDFFFVNAFHLSTDYVLSFPQPFSVANLPPGMPPFSPRLESGELPFLGLIDPAISFDFLGGMFLAVFRRAAWTANAGAISHAGLRDDRVFSTFDNTFPHVRIFARAFARSKAYFQATPLSVCLSGAREWAPMYPMVKSVRLVEALEEYRRNGLPLHRYLVARNYALNTFLPDLAAMYLHRETSGYRYVSPGRLILNNALYPNTYLSAVYFLFRRGKKAVRRFLNMMVDE